MKKDSLDELEEKITLLDKETKVYLKKITELVYKQQHKSNDLLISYFTYSLNINHTIGEESLCIGSYNIINLGSSTISSPYICIKLPAGSPFNLSGKILNKNSSNNINVPDAWKRINEQSDKEEFWLQPMNKKGIEPSGVLSFKNFQIRWTPEQSYKGTIMGFTYSENNREGKAAINSIDVNGTFRERREEGE
ncbi:hypothetical protein [Thalassobacillus devorans]|uniref:hypothetical protein n=1 Tax=Thalassobacillus devorans TaxID=279813 RepID=UPI0004AD0A8B|nr:hypothetical protein [Thalassobacillus devorans]